MLSSFRKIKTAKGKIETAIDSVIFHISISSVCFDKLHILFRTFAFV